MGKVFLIFVVSILAAPCYQSTCHGEILLMPEPEAILPPPIEDLDGEKAFQRLRQRRTRRRSNAKKLVEAKTSLETLLKQEAKKERNYKYLIQLSLIYPQVLTTAQRQAYTTEITSHVTALKRFSAEKSPYVSQWWWGLRLAPFAGTGTYDATVGRYGFFYFGPSFAIGALSITHPDLKNKDNSLLRSKNMQVPKRSAWLLNMGLSLQTRNAVVSSTDQVAEKDLNTVRGAKLDPPGLWAEFTYAKIYYGGLGVHYVSGVQLGEGKIFIWLGLAAGAWH